jgi:hypothetical protein
MLRPGHPDWGQYVGAAKNYVDPILWVPSLALEAYNQAVKEEDPPEEDNNGSGGYKPMEEAICRSILISEA